ncbi:hypothetical protein [Sphingomicrobium aestuariivivum]|uniref:hypothetical protein n=1 Tax=Sphingomicrobium aestuariivivum TaxID=1582356 RepID=UPI001FD6D0AC|nr:hypothetical protein [Sphingomicrobium aestuariivivum]MCJ8191910.1 hypothetical protein [Sphingomicrobium aestuariivivum]
MSASRATFRPRLALRFGITGHRPPRLDPALNASIHADIARIFRRSTAALAELHEAHASMFDPRPAKVKLVSSLAEGADVIAAEAALDTGVSLSACLPMPQERYARDFEPAEWQRTLRLIEQSDNVLTLSSHDKDEVGYEAAGRIVLAQCDILIAVWDGESAAGRGGTTQIVAEAIARHLPVIHVHARGEAPPQLMWSGLHEAIPDRPSLDGVQRASAFDSLASLVEALCAPPTNERDAECLRAFLEEKVASPRSYSWPLLLSLTGARPWRRFSVRAASPEDSARWFAPLTHPFAGHGSFGTQLNERLLPRFARADSRAGIFALRFRSSFVSNFAMAGLAVFLALLGLLVPEAKKLLIAIELLVILLIIANTRGARKVDLHRRWLEHRHLAERLRLLALSAPLGRLGLRDVEDGTTHPNWVAWYARATARELGLVRAHVDAAYLEKLRRSMQRMIDEQERYHRGNASAMHQSNHVLHKAGDLLFAGTVVACAAYLALAFTIGTNRDILGLGLAGLVTFVTALFPALAAAFYGIRMQGDFAAAAERSNALVRQLARLRNAIDGDEPEFGLMAERSRRLGDIMLSEFGQWQMHYETRPLSLPG